jgi:hypothetical protein
MRGKEWKAEKGGKGETFVRNVYRAIPADADYRPTVVEHLNAIRRLVAETRYGQKGTTYSAYEDAIRLLVERIGDAVPTKAPKPLRDAVETLAEYVAPAASAARQAERAGDSQYQPWE